MLYYIVAHSLRFKYDISEGGEPLAQDAQRNCGCPISGSVQYQLGCGPGGWELDDLKVLYSQNPSMIGFYDIYLNLM